MTETVETNTSELGYENRTLTTQTVKELGRNSSGDGGWVTGSGGWTAGASTEVLDLLTEGKTYGLETIGFSRITGFFIDGQWYNRKSDETLQREHEEFVAKVKRDRQESLDRNRAAWLAQEEALPEWLKARLATFHEKGGEEFELDGWGYELMVCMLAAEYAKLGDVILDKDLFAVSEHESEAIKAMAEEHGTSGNQHGVALALAKAHLKEPERSLAGTVSALSPITGSAFYEKS